MKFGMVLPCYLPNQQRVMWAESSLASLAATKTEGLDSPPLFFSVLKGEDAHRIINGTKFSGFYNYSITQPDMIHSNDGCLVWAWQQLASRGDITHIFMLTDDWLYNPNWLLELQALVRRKPGAKAWWTYRSTYEEIHRTIREEKDAVLVRSINAGGCITVEELREWNLDWRTCPRENGENGRLSLDLLHPLKRPGDRWVTPRSYILNIGLRGVCQTPETNDLARDFVGF